MIMARNIGFVFDTPQYKGGFYYLVTLVEAILLSTSNQVVIFVGSQNSKDQFQGHISNLRVQVVVIKLLNPVNPANPIFKCIRILGLPFFFQYLAFKYTIDVFSHSEAPLSWLFNYKAFNWIPDLQFIDLPQNFSLFMRVRYWQRFLSFIINSDKIIFSSNHSRQRCLELYPYLRSKINTKASVLQFCSSKLPDCSYRESILSELSKTGLDPSQPFIFLPNQFWQHKNHIIFLKAFQRALDYNPAMQLVLTGINHDFRNPLYSSTLSSDLRNFRFGPNIYYFTEVSRFLFAFFLNNCSALANPSLYEGWSTTIEEAMSIGKYLLISEISVNIEQTQGYDLVSFFDPLSLESITTSLLELFKISDYSNPNTSKESFYKLRYNSYLQAVRQIYE
jgi:glycosyltransferase involved in cell wall biosynthesis